MRNTLPPAESAIAYGGRRQSRRTAAVAVGPWPWPLVVLADLRIIVVEAPPAFAALVAAALDGAGPPRKAPGSSQTTPTMCSWSSNANCFWIGSP